jgi:hypothetical protein
VIVMPQRRQERDLWHLAQHHHRHSRLVGSHFCP